MSRIFISHSSHNSAEAIAIQRWLALNGWNDVFLDLDPKRGIAAGQQWQEALKAAANRCEVVIFLISQEWAQSKWCLAEFLLAKQLNKKIFSVIVAPILFSDLPAEMTAEWQITDLISGSPRQEFPVPGAEPGEATIVAFSEAGLMRLRYGLAISGVGATHFPWPPAHDPRRPAYRGLLPYESEDAGIFFGRDGAIIEALDKLRGARDGTLPRVIAIVGASGAGKSSFLRAGVIPRVMRDDSNFLVLPVIRPLTLPINGAFGLCQSIEGAYQAARIPIARAKIRENVANSGDAVIKLLIEPLISWHAQTHSHSLETARPPLVVLPVDQAEELFPTSTGTEAARFIDLLVDLLASKEIQCCVLLTIRNEFVRALEENPSLEETPIQSLGLRPMLKGAYGEIIRGPARRLEGTSRALIVDDDLVDQLLSDVEAGDTKDALPLLAFTLERLYVEYGGSGRLSLSAYGSLGGIGGAIETAVAGVLSATYSDPSIPADLAKRIQLLRASFIPLLATIDPETRMPRRRVAPLREIPSSARPLIDAMVEHRLLSVDVAKETGSTTVEPAHEALLRNWKELRAWLEEEADALSSLDALRKAAADWWKNGKVTDWIVHVGSRLGMADQICQRSDFKKLVTEVEEQYLRRAHMEEAERRKPAERAAMLLAEIGHEIGTPLAALGATAKSSINFALRELTSDRRSPPSEIVAKLNQSQDRIEQLLEVLRTTMDSAVVLADVASDRKSLRMKYTALIPLIERSWSEAARTAGARRGQSDLSAPQMRMKSYKTDVRVRGDEDALLGALREIFKNSIIYTIDSGDRARQYCEVAIAETIGEILVSVSNFGPEIPIEERQRIFEPGYRGSSGRIRAARGVGMGLSFARQIMQLHGGSISLVSSSKVIDPNKSASDAVEGGELCRNTFELRFSKGGDFVNI